MSGHATPNMAAKGWRHSQDEGEGEGAGPGDRAEVRSEVRRKCGGDPEAGEAACLSGSAGRAGLWRRLLGDHVRPGTGDAGGEGQRPGPIAAPAPPSLSDSAPSCLHRSPQSLFPRGPAAPLPRCRALASPCIPPPPSAPPPQGPVLSGPGRLSSPSPHSRVGVGAGAPH